MIHVKLGKVKIRGFLSIRVTVPTHGLLALFPFNIDLISFNLPGDLRHCVSTLVQTADWLKEICCPSVDVLTSMVLAVMFYSDPCQPVTHLHRSGCTVVNHIVSLPMTCLMMTPKKSFTHGDCLEFCSWGVGDLWHRVTLIPSKCWQMMFDEWSPILISEQPPPARAWDQDPDSLSGLSGVMPRSARRNGTATRATML